MKSLVISRRRALALATALLALGVSRVPPCGATPIGPVAGMSKKAAAHEPTPWRGDAAARFARHAAFREPARL